MDDENDDDNDNMHLQDLEYESSSIVVAAAVGKVLAEDFPKGTK